MSVAEASQGHIPPLLSIRIFNYKHVTKKNLFIIRRGLDSFSQLNSALLIYQAINLQELAQYSIIESVAEASQGRVPPLLSIRNIYNIFVNKSYNNIT